MSYILDVAKIRHGRVDDGVLEFAYGSGGILR